MSTAAVARAAGLLLACPHLAEMRQVLADGSPICVGCGSCLVRGVWSRPVLVDELESATRGNPTLADALDDQQMIPLDTDKRLVCACGWKLPIPLYLRVFLASPGPHSVRSFRMGIGCGACGQRHEVDFPNPQKLGVAS